MNVRLLLLCVLVLISACAPYQGSFRERGIAAANSGNWEAAYRFSEDALLSDNAEKRLEARQFILHNSQIYKAAAQTFSSDALHESIQKYGETNAYSIEKNRLLAYEVVATPQDYSVAAEVFDKIFGEIKKVKEARARELVLAEEVRARDLELAEADKRMKQAQRIQQLHELEALAKISCRNELECKKAFALTEIFAAEYSDMKIQISTGNIIETYNPTKSYNIGLRAVKTPLQEDSAEIEIRVVCAADARAEYCEERKLAIYKAYLIFLSGKLMS